MKNKPSPHLSDSMLTIAIKEQDLGAILASSVNMPPQSLLVIKQADNVKNE